MNKFRVRYFVLALLVLCCAGRYGLQAQELSTPQKVWDVFLDSLRRGDMKTAYDCIMPYAKKQMSYRDFCASWHPLTFKYESVLTPPGFSEFRISGDIATLRLGLRREPGESEGHISKAALIRDSGRWWVVDGPSASLALAEASARNVLSRLVTGSKLVRQGLSQGKMVSVEQLRRENPRFFEELSVREFFAAYDLEVDVLRDGVIRARPKREKLRGYSASLDGRVVAYNSLPPQRITGEQVQVNDEINQRQKQIAQLKEQEQASRKARELALKKTAKPVATKVKVAAPDDKIDSSNLKPGVMVKRPIQPRNLPPRAPDFGDPDKASGVLKVRRAKLRMPAVADEFELPDVEHINRQFSKNSAPVGKATALSSNVKVSTAAQPEVELRQQSKDIRLPEGTVVESRSVSRKNGWQKEVIEVEVPGISAMSIAEDDYAGSAKKRSVGKDSKLLEGLLEDF